MRFEQRPSGDRQKATPDNITTFFVPEADGAPEEIPALFDVFDPGEKPRLHYRTPRSQLVSEIERLVYDTPTDQVAKYEMPGGVRVSTMVEQRDGVTLALLSFEGLDLDKPWRARQANRHQLESGKAEILAVTIPLEGPITIDRSVMSPREDTGETHSSAQFEADLEAARRPIDEKTISEASRQLEKISRFDQPEAFFNATKAMTGGAEEASYRLGDTGVEVVNFNDPYSGVPHALLRVTQEFAGVRQLGDLFSRHTPKECHVVEYQLQDGEVIVKEASGREGKLQYRERDYIGSRHSSQGLVTPDDRVIWAVLRRTQTPRSEDERLT